MINKYFDWVARTAYSIDKRLGQLNGASTYNIDRFSEIEEKTREGQAFGTGGMIATLLVLTPFLLIGLVAWFLPISDNAKLLAIALDGLAMLIVCIVFIVKLYKDQKTGSVWLGSKVQQMDPKNQFTPDSSNSANPPKYNDGPDKEN
ncbi:MAG: hypothetical protein WCG30_03105 [Candidatus Saccharibacteria bacterium]